MNLDKLKQALEDLSERYHGAMKFEVHLHPSAKTPLMKSVLEEDSLRGYDYLFDKSVVEGTADIHIRLQTIVRVDLGE